LTGGDASSNPSRKPVVQDKGLKAEDGKHRVAMNASHRNKAIKGESPKQIAASHRNKKAKADKRKHQSPAEANHIERAPGPRVLLPSDPTNVGNPTPAPQLPPDLTALKQAIHLVQQHKIDEATTLAASIDDPVAQKVFEWAYLRDPESRAGFDRYNNFLQNNPAWSSTLLRRRAEARLWQERRDAATVRRFIGEQPVSIQGRLAVARAIGRIVSGARSRGR
jgi:soluble lytic murein transglycosylase